MNDLHAAAAYQAMDRVSLSGNKLAERPERDLQYIIGRINECIGNAGASRDRVRDIADRVKGAVPECVEKDGLASGGLGNISEIHSLLDTLTNVLGDLGSNIGRIESL